eukprot:CAMPEP_0168188170 /NCGR_PEP_ID=MMETSP0139_2-20121125/15482_1 /TAXON_ID=44445 /ORGANISM="Pseudo-nitzschia australis, Strain 10249 10 AB" /LENGTH=1021 /DNA_ID=CAMNT_0008110545 /DNA_START=44 /DNA_END=3109 /DNA_ORIENTATION=-
MSESLLEDVDLDLAAAAADTTTTTDDDAINDLLKEAETLMQDLPLDMSGEIEIDANESNGSANNADTSAAINIGGNFSIDDDDDYNGNGNGNGNSGDKIDNSLDDPLRAAAVSSASATTTASASATTTATSPQPRRSSPSIALRVFQELEDDHPLSAASLKNTTNIPLDEPDTNTNNIGNINMNNNNMNNNNHRNSMSSTMSNIFNGNSGMGGVINNMNRNMNMGRGNGNGTGDGASSGIDALSKTTSMFASNLASMAQRGMAHVAAAAAPSQPVNVMGAASGVGVGGIGQGPTMGMGGLQSWPNNNSNTANGNGNGNVFSGNAPMGPNSIQAGTASGPGVGAGPVTTTTGTSAGTSAGAGAGPAGYPQLDKDQKRALLKKHVGNLFKGEQVIMFLTNLLHVGETTGLSFVASQQQQLPGAPIIMWCCVMTYYRLIFFSTADSDNDSMIATMEPPAGWDRNCWKTATPRTASIRLLEIPLASMDRVEKTVYQASGSSYMGLVIYGKDCGRIIRFSTPSFVDTGRAFDSLNTYAFPGRRNLGYLFAFESKRQEVQDSIKVDEKTGQQGVTLPPTPKRFDPMTEYPRLIQKTTITQSPWALWGSANSTYQLSQSYPSVLVGPASLDETKPEALNVVRQCSAFRKAQRLPSMTWCGAGGASIWRSSQPKVGLQGNRSPADELYLRHIIESARGANAMAEPSPIYPRAILEQLTGDYTASSGSGGKRDDWVPDPGCGLKILDLRPRAAAIANRTGGYGYENTSNYSNTTLQFCNIQNIHAVRDSYGKLCTVCNNKSTADVQWNSLIEDTKWLSHIRTILAASWETAYWVHVWRIPVLVHCSHGWDRTSQTVCLSQLLLDSFYRTRHGFSVLVEKDFMSFGHPFHLRSAHGEGRNDTKNGSQSNDEGQISPIFLQFLDCVYQLVELYPSAFEFNTQYLLELSFHVYSCRFGNMICDTEREREAMAAIRQRTYSVWDHLDAKPEYINQSYVETDDAILMPLPTVLRNVKLWKERHFAYSPKSSTMLF